MRWSTYVSPPDGEEHAALLDGDLHGLRAAAGGLIRLLDLLGDAGELLSTAADYATADPVDVLPLEGLEQAGGGCWRRSRCRPVDPRLLRQGGHVRTLKQANGEQMDPDWFELPVFYFQNPTAVGGARDDVAIAPGAQRFDYELEFAAVIGPGGSDLAPDVAEPFRGGKAFSLRLTASVNSVPYSSGDAADLYRSFGQMIAYASRGTSVRPGDLIGSRHRRHRLHSRAVNGSRLQPLSLTGTG